MEKNFTNENMEQFLRQNADGLRMLPSDKVWKSISKHFQQRRRRNWGLFMIIGLLVTTVTGYYVINDIPADTTSVATNANPTNTLENKAEKNSVTGSGLLPENKTAGMPAANSKSESQLEFAPLLMATVRSHKSDVEGSGDISGSVLPNNIEGSDNTEEQNNTVPEDANNTTGSEQINDYASAIIDDTYPVIVQEENRIPASQQHALDPMSIESVVNTFVPAKRKKIDMQIYFTPTVSYRKLSENKAYLKTVSPSNIPSNQQNLYDINNFVTHKPDFGFELGLTGKYSVTKDVRLKAGLQFNVNRYDIKVFNSSTQLATIRLNNRNGMDSVNRVTNYSNTPNGKSNWLENFYFQVSAPIGVEFKIKGDDKIEFGIASTVQPTYVLGDRAYLISTDYKNYAEVPWLIRRWNVNTSLETFVSYSTGKLNWQVGPQVRYQLLSSFVKKYPVKENLFDFGLKVGIGLNKQ